MKEGFIDTVSFSAFKYVRHIQASTKRKIFINSKETLKQMSVTFVLQQYLPLYSTTV